MPGFWVSGDFLRKHVESTKIFKASRELEAGATFDNSFFENSFVLVRQLKNRLFLGSVFVHVTGRTKN
jgi:hypothetical protein